MKKQYTEDVIYYYPVMINAGGSTGVGFGELTKEEVLDYFRERQETLLEPDQRVFIRTVVTSHEEIFPAEPLEKQAG